MLRVYDAVAAADRQEEHPMTLTSAFQNNKNCPSFTAFFSVEK